MHTLLRLAQEAQRLVDRPGSGLNAIQVRGSHCHGLLRFGDVRQRSRARIERPADSAASASAAARARPLLDLPFQVRSWAEESTLVSGKTASMWSASFPRRCASS